METRTEAFFLAASPGRSGQRFCIFHAAHGPAPKGCILYIHPFAEEMNKSRRMAATQSREFSLAGYAVLQIDLLGCGDSSDDFGDATWDGWLQDVAQGAQWLLDKVDAPLWLWGVRAGCLLASDVARNLAEPCNFVFWAATPSGKAVWQQFTRLKAAGEMLSGNAKGVAEVLRQQLAEGLSVEVAGYRISPALAGGMERAVLDPPASPVPDARLVWLDISTRVDPTLSPAAQRSIERWEQAGFHVHGQCVQGPSFWQTTEIEDAPELIAATVAAMSETLASVAT